ncbi:hypothetical protein F511_36933 [Dorcoceras hygrometricum]|uniref:Uncharacterized protein n=1 Tax=Dorcoceras hygrometricum TaxID=472368 RepID=A0A2Z7CIE7_9LAMI|nr:hypothetical protein F511_36933 [Dorcoceras hygrometricum]
MSLRGLVCFFLACFQETQVLQLVVVSTQLMVPQEGARNPGSTAGRGFNPAGGAPGVLSYNYNKSSPEQPNLKPAKSNNNANSGTQAQNYELGTTTSTSSVLPFYVKKQALNKAQDYTREASFAIFFKLNPSLQKRYDKNRLGKRIPALPLLRLSDLPTAYQLKKKSFDEQ